MVGTSTWSLVGLVSTPSFTGQTPRPVDGQLLRRAYSQVRAISPIGATSKKVCGHLFGESINLSPRARRFVSSSDLRGHGELHERRLRMPGSSLVHVAQFHSKHLGGIANGRIGPKDCASIGLVMTHLAQLPLAFTIVS